jgi:hypothetical protein
MCVATLEVEVNGQSVIKTLDFSGNATSSVLYGAVRIVNELQEMLGQEPQGFVEKKTERKRKA